MANPRVSNSFIFFLPKLSTNIYFKSFFDFFWCFRFLAIFGYFFCQISGYFLVYLYIRQSQLTFCTKPMLFCIFFMFSLYFITLGKFHRPDTPHSFAELIKLIELVLWCKQNSRKTFLFDFADWYDCFTEIDEYEWYDGCRFLNKLSVVLYRWF